jgi:hypothetical protein
MTFNRYERILDRIKSKDSEEQMLATRLLQWMTCSTRILTLRELEDALAIRPGDLTVDKDKRPYRVRLGTICGPIVEVIGEDSMVFVHFSAKGYVYFVVSVVWPCNKLTSYKIST